jgi:hypothetical protein
MAIVLHHSRARGTDKVILLGIANHEGDGGAWPRMSTLAKYANVNTRNARAAVERLVRAGEVARFVQQGGPRDMPDDERPNRYEVLLSCPAWCDRTTRHQPRRGWQAMGDGTYSPEPAQMLSLPTVQQLEQQQQQLDAGLPDTVPAEPLWPEDDPAPRAPTPATPPPADALEAARAALRASR